MGAVEQGVDIELGSAEKEDLLKYLREKRTAILAILFSDIVGYTRLCDEMGEMFSSEVRSFFWTATSNAVTSNNRGCVVKNIGDSYLCVFAEPSEAVRAALEMQESFRAFPGLDGGLKVRIGIHLGQVALEKSLHFDIFGSHVNRAARIMALADGGHIFVTRPVYENAEGWLKKNSDPDLNWVLHGEYELKGLRHASSVHEVYPPEVTPKAPTAEKAGSLDPSPRRSGKTSLSHSSRSELVCSACGKTYRSLRSLPGSCGVCSSPLCLNCTGIHKVTRCAKHVEQ